MPVYRFKAFFAILFLVSDLLFAQARTISGTVFLDDNRNGELDRNEKGLEAVGISNGRDVVLSDDFGRYSISVDDDDIVFLIKPSGYRPRLSDDYVQQSYGFNKPNGSPDLHFKGVEPSRMESPLNFGLYENQDEDSLKVGLLGDIQAKTIDDVYYLSKVVAEKMMDERYDFLVALGDITYDNLRLFEPIKQVLGKIQAPVYYVYGNHDRNYDGKVLQHRDETYELNFGPSYYAFDYGRHSFIALNNVYPKPHYKYQARIDPDQMEFVENYLKTVPVDNDIHLLIHIPLEQLVNIKAFSGLFENHPKVHAYAGHTHIQFFETIDENNGWVSDHSIEELVAGAVCGSWWHGEKDIFGVPQSMMSDGTPKGFWTMQLSDGKKKYDYKVSEPDNRQMHIWTPFDFDRELIDFENNEIVANVYAGNEETEVEVKIGHNDWKAMDQIKGIDPFYDRLYALQKKGIGVNENTLGIGKPRESRHLWRMDVPDSLESGVHLIKVRAKNRYGLEVMGKTMLFHDTNNAQYFIPEKNE